MGSNVKSVKEAHIIIALLKLDKVNKLPYIVIDVFFFGLSAIPRSHPEE